MGYRLRRELREVLGPDINGLQRAVALEIADDAREETRASMAPLEDLVRWTGAKDGKVVRNALKRLAEAGWEFRVPIGTGKDGRVLYAVPGRRMTFRVPRFEGVATASSSPLEGVAVAASEAAVASPSGVQGVAVAGSEAAGAHSEAAVASPSSSSPSGPSEVISTSPEEERAAAPPSEREYAMTKFGAFWLVYPRSKQSEKAKQAWRDAIDRGADPDHIVKAATAYANERSGQDPKYTPFPATWLDRGCYDDEPDPEPGPHLQSVSGGWQPWSNPTDQSVYLNGW